MNGRILLTRNQCISELLMQKTRGGVVEASTLCFCTMTSFAFVTVRVGCGGALVLGRFRTLLWMSRV